MPKNKKSIWVFPDGFILFETFSNSIEEVEDFLITISEPVSRTRKIHEYVLTPYALYAAVTSGMKGMDIVKILKKLSKNLLPKTIFRMISICTKFFGKIHLILYKNNYFIYAPNQDLVKILLNDKKFKKFPLHIIIHPKKISKIFPKLFGSNLEKIFINLKSLVQKKF